MNVQTTTVMLIACSAFTACAPPQVIEPHAPRGDAARGKVVISALECNVCHEIPGVRGPRGHVGPTLDAYGRSVYLAGKFPNTADGLARWVRDAPSLAPSTAMPAVAMSEQDAHDIAAYLYSLE